MSGEPPLWQRLARACGVLEGYHDIWGRYHPLDPEAARAILRAMGLRVDTEEDLAAELALREQAGEARLCEPFLALSEGGAHRIPLSVPADRGPWRASLTVGGRRLELRDDGPAGGHGRLFALPAPLPPGVADVAVEAVSPAGTLTARTRLAVAPERGYAPERLAGGGRVWGVHLPLYGVRSGRNWGIGDFEDLHGVVEWAADLGADLVGLLPLHALSNASPHGVSPYFPWSRIFLNPVYVAVDRVAEAAEPEVAQALASEPFRGTLAELREASAVDYDRVWRLKREALALCHRAFRRRHLEAPGGPSPRGREFLAWREAQGGLLESFATFCALAEAPAHTGAGPRPWRDWAPGLRAPDSPAVRAFQREHAGEVALHAYFQWIAEAQLGRARRRATERGMAVGLYLDLALGVDPWGADAWVYRDVLALGASAGAPPDPFSLTGQRWGVPPPIPERHRATGYECFFETLRRNARRAGALRLDHVMALWRLFWVPGDLPPGRGAYVTDRTDELLALVRAVSRQERCLVVGEDLGTVPPEVREQLMASGLFSYRLLLFEKHPDGRFRRPDELPRQALVSFSTHDLPPLDGFWLGTDLALKSTLGRYPTPEAEQGDAEERARDRVGLLEALGGEGMLPPGIDPRGPLPEGRLEDLAAAVHAYLARAPSALLLANVDDLLGERHMQNLPGTLDEHPNWRRRFSAPLEQWSTHRRCRRVAEAIARER
ncbi:MAG: 4-alpha-glucanotransferase [Deferrisomatales bacterium]